VPIQAEARERYRVWVRFDDGAEGVVDLAHLAGRGVCRAWDEPGVFERAHVSAESGTVTWPGEIDLDPDVLHRMIVGAGAQGGGRAA
jgi:hypothetical protein